MFFAWAVAGIRAAEITKKLTSNAMLTMHRILFIIAPPSTYGICVNKRAWLALNAVDVFQARPIRLAHILVLSARY
jgi:hypothetical protein